MDLRGGEEKKKLRETPTSSGASLPVVAKWRIAKIGDFGCCIVRLTAVVSLGVRHINYRRLNDHHARRETRSNPSFPM